MEKEDKTKSLDKNNFENPVTFYKEELYARAQLATYRFGGGEQHLDLDTDLEINPIRSPDKIDYRTTTEAPARKKKNGDS